MHQGRGLQRLAGFLVGQLLRRQLAQLLVDQRQKLVGRMGIALLNGGQDAGNLTHRRHRTLENLNGMSSPSSVGTVWDPCPRRVAVSAPIRDARCYRQPCSLYACCGQIPQGRSPANAQRRGGLLHREAAATEFLGATRGSLRCATFSTSIFLFHCYSRAYFHAHTWSFSLTRRNRRVSERTTTAWLPVGKRASLVTE